MSKKEYTNEELSILKQNQYIQKCSPKYLQFSNACKHRAMELDSSGVYYKNIFVTLGFPDFFIDSNAPSRCIKAWRRKLQEGGKQGLSRKKKGRKIKDQYLDIDNMSHEEQNILLKAQLAYALEENKVLKGIKKKNVQKSKDIP